MKIVFVYPPFWHKKFNENVAVVDNEFGVYQPMGLAYAAAVLRRAGAEVGIIDANAESLNKRKTLERLEKLRPDVIGFDHHSAYVFYDMLDWIRYFKRNLPGRARIVVGGFNVNLYGREVMGHKEIDYGFMGPMNACPEKFIAFFDGHEARENVPGLIFRQGGRLVMNETVRRYENIDNLPYPARDLLPMDRYYSYISKRKNFTVMLGQLGCPFRCTYCAVAQIPYVKRTAENIFGEILECYHKYNVRDIDFFDGTFTADRKLTHTLCDLIIEHKLDLFWSCRTRVDCIDGELLRKMAASGCQRIYYGVESISDRVLAAVRKDVKPEKFSSAIALTRSCGIEPLCFYMIGNPEDTVESFRQSMRFAKKIGAEYVQICRTIAKPKTELHQKLIRATGRDYWSDYISGKAEEKRLPNPWCGISEAKMEELIKRSYMSFYFRPRYILRRIIRTRSLHELRRFIRVGIKMFLSSFKREDV